MTMVEWVEKIICPRYLGHSLMMNTSEDMFDHRLRNKTILYLTEFIFLASKYLNEFPIEI
jgi:hypothetical protein